MSWKFYNPNPKGNFVGDCVIRAISLACNQSWDEIYVELTSQGFNMKDMPSSNVVWGVFLRHKGFKRYIIPNECPDCYNVKEFCYENSNRGRSYEDGYSGHDKEEMIDYLMKMMRSARTEEERENYRKTIAQLER